MKKAFLFVFVFTFFVHFSLAGDNARLLRFPDINNKLVVFVYAGDIWSVSADGGDAKRLTSHLGLELFPKISPDGKWIAFSGEYSGSRQVYIMPSTGGIPKQLTYYNDVGVMPPRGGFDNQVLDWTPDSQKILIRANRTPYGKRMGKYFLVPINGGLETPLQIPEAGGGTFSADGNKIVYTPISREWRTWKRYKGGRAQDVWIYDLEHNKSKRLTDFPGTDQHPIWYKNKIYFVSDRDLTLNMYSYHLDTEDIEQITDYDKYNILWPSGTNGLIVYENGGTIYKFDMDSGKNQKLTVNINFDNPNILPYFKEVDEDIQSFDISSTGKRAVFEARGDVFTVPAQQGITYNLTDSQGIREMSPSWSPDGRYIAFYSDKTGEYEIYLMDKSQDNKIIQLTSDSKVWKFPCVWSPDSSKLLYSEKNQKLNIIDINTKEMSTVDKAKYSDIGDYSWSPDSKWVIYTKASENRLSALWVYSLEQKKAFQLTNDMYNDFSPVFSTCGKYIFFLSNRSFNLSFSSFEFDYLYNNATKIYSVALTDQIPPLFKDKNDVEEIKEPKKDKKKPSKEQNKETLSVKIDIQGINSRIISFPLRAGNYRDIYPVEGGILYFKNGAVHQYKINEKKDSVVIQGISALDLSADGKKILYRFKNKFGITAIKPNQKPDTGALDLSDMTVKINPRIEWKQLFNDGWKIYRDWFYVKNLHGVDWKKIKAKYEELIPYLGHRADLDFLFGEMVGELNVGHCYVNWGDFERPERVDTGLLGAQLTADKKSKRYIISKIYEGENWNENRRSPLTEQGIQVKEGDFLISIDGEDVFIKDNPYRFLENKVGGKVEISVNSKPEKENQRTYLIEPVKSELELFYLDWVKSRRRMVDELSGGRIGYFHVPNTSTAGNRELFKGFYAFKDKDALIIDERYNGGGFIPDVMTGLLSRTVLSYWARRGIKLTQTPAAAHEGPKAMLINHYSSSGGDAFPYYFKKKNLGVLIGTRTWGGLVGISGNPRLADGGYLSVPTFGFVDTDGKWAVEGIGVYPDIEVYDRPELVAEGKDPSLQKAIEYLLKELEKNPPKKIEKPEGPDRSKWIKKDIK
ncbi:MAG: S41 family peptidase [Candidatus Aminicenantaceae bacterium]